MTKIKEDETFVYYKFETSAVVVSSYRTENGELRNKSEIKYGYCKLNKKTEEFKLDQEKTDQHFLGEKGERTVKIAYIILLSYKRKNLDFPDEIYRAYG